MLMSLLSRLLIIIFGTLHPAYKSYKALKYKNYQEQIKLMMYWIVFAIYSVTENFLDYFLFWFPFYYEIKILFLLWTLSPMSRGGIIVYRKFIHPSLISKEQAIDEFIEKSKNQGHRVFFELVTFLMNYASNFLIAFTTTFQLFLNSHLNKNLINEKYKTIKTSKSTEDIANFVKKNKKISENISQSNIEILRITENMCQSKETRDIN
jgi:receptor expression-enhancing protein 1/2/3/4